MLIIKFVKYAPIPWFIRITFKPLKCKYGELHTFGTGKIAIDVSWKFLYSVEFNRNHDVLFG